MFVVFIRATVNLLEITYIPQSASRDEGVHTKRTRNHREVCSCWEVRRQHVRYCDLAKQGARFWDVGKRVDVGVQCVLVEGFRPIFFVSWRKGKGTRKRTCLE
jgi:hypothetical protein